MTRLQSLPLGLLFVLLVGSCSSGSGGGEDAESLDIDGVLSLAADAMSNVDTVLFTIDLEGADVFLDDNGLMGFRMAEGRFAAPSSADAVIAVNARGLATEVGAVAIDGEAWITNPLTGDWEPAPEAFTFDPALLFDPEVGFSDLLANGLTNPELVSAEPDADQRYHITAGVDPVRVVALTGNLIDDVDNVELWVDAASGFLTEMTFDAGIDAGGTSWQLLLTDYGSAVTIIEPDLD